MPASDRVVACVDAEGGDHAPEQILEGVAQGVAADPELEVILTGASEIVEPFAAERDRISARATTEPEASTARETDDRDDPYGRRPRV